jgi:hypothetical protein
MTDQNGNSILDHVRGVSRAVLNLYMQVCPNMVYTDDLQALENIRAAFEALKRPAYTEGQLRRQSNGRWLLSQQGDFEFTSGSPVEIWDGENWEKTSIEHAGSKGGYYAVNGMPLKDGSWIRIPRIPR